MVNNNCSLFLGVDRDLAAENTYSKAYWNDASRIPAAGSHPCLEYEDAQKMRCKRCDTARNYYRLLRNMTHVMCGYFSLYNSMTKTGSRTCIIRAEHYPNDVWLINYAINVSIFNQAGAPYPKTVKKDDGLTTE